MAVFTVRCRRAGEDTGRAPVRGTIALTYSTITYFIVLYERRSKHLSIVRPMSFCDPTQQGVARCLDPSGRGRLCLFHGDYAAAGQVISAVTDEEIC